MRVFIKNLILFYMICSCTAGYATEFSQNLQDKSIRMPSSEQFIIILFYAITHAMNLPQQLQEWQDKLIYASYNEHRGDVIEFADKLLKYWPNDAWINYEKAAALANLGQYR